MVEPYFNYNSHRQIFEIYSGAQCLWEQLIYCVRTNYFQATNCTISFKIFKIFILCLHVYTNMLCIVVRMAKIKLNTNLMVNCVDMENICETFASNGDRIYAINNIIYIWIWLFFLYKKNGEKNL